MKVKILKTGKWAIKPPKNENIEIIEGEIRNDIPAHLVEKMIEKGWAEKALVGRPKKTDE